MSTLRAPRGVTSIGGAKVYAAKLATADYDQLELGRPLSDAEKALTFAQDHC